MESTKKGCSCGCILFSFVAASRRGSMWASTPTVLPVLGQDFQLLGDGRLALGHGREDFAKKFVQLPA